MAARFWLRSECAGQGEVGEGVRERVWDPERGGPRLELAVVVHFGGLYLGDGLALSARNRPLAKLAF